MNKELELEAEQYAQAQCEDMFNQIGLTGAEWGWETKTDFIAGATSKYIEKQKLKFAVEQLLDIRNKMSFYEISNMDNTLDNLNDKIIELEKQISEL